MKFIHRLIAGLGLIASLASFQPAHAQVVNFKNLLINGEALIANTGTATLTGVSNTATYGADGWAGFGGASSSMVVGRSTANLPTGFQQAFSFQRTASNANTAQLCGVQEISTDKTKEIAGQSVIFSFYGAVGSTFTGASSNAQITVISGTGSDEGLATLISGWTGAKTLVANQAAPLTTVYSRQGVVVAVPSTATELAVETCWTPVGTASGTTDSLLITGTQLEIAAGTCPAVPGGTGYTAQVAGVCATPYEHIAVDIEALRDNFLFQQFNETAAGTNNIAACQSTSTTVAQCTLPLSPAMRATPALAFTAGGLKVLVGATPTAITAGPAAVASSQSVYAATFTATTGATQTLGQAVAVQGSGAGTGIITASARF